MLSVKLILTPMLYLPLDIWELFKILILASTDLSSLGAIVQGWHSQDPWKGTGFPLIFEQQGVTPSPHPISQRQAASLASGARREAGLSARAGLRRGEVVSVQLAVLALVLFVLLCLVRPDSNNSKKALGKGSFFRIYCSTGRK